MFPFDRSETSVTDGPMVSWSGERCSRHGGELGSTGDPGRVKPTDERTEETENGPPTGMLRGEAR